MHSTMDHTLRYLLLIRLVVIGGQIVALAAMDFLFGVAVPWLAVSLVLALLAVFTARSWQRLGRAALATDQRHYLVQSLADIAALSALIYLTGGAFNPFVSLFLVPIIFAAAAMPLADMTGIARRLYRLDHEHRRSAGRQRPPHRHRPLSRHDCR